MHDRPAVLGISLSHAGRVIDASTGLTKLDLARYHAAVAEAELPHVQDRPLTLVRCPGSVDQPCAFMRHSKIWAPSALRRVRIQEQTKLGEYLIADTAEALVALAQMDVIEIHTWNTRASNLEKPDRVVFDLDPGPLVKWPAVIECARRLRAFLHALGLASFVKTTGGRGLHLVVPLLPERDWSDCLSFARAVAQTMERDDPARYTTRYAKAGREAKILLDYLRNNRTNTAVAAFSPRARPSAPVSTPIAWSELTPRLRPGRFSVLTVPRRLQRPRADPWRGMSSLRQHLPRIG